jgi:hypothetical protein
MDLKWNLKLGGVTFALAAPNDISLMRKHDSFSVTFTEHIPNEEYEFTKALVNAWSKIARENEQTMSRNLFHLTEDELVQGAAIFESLGHKQTKAGGDLALQSSVTRFRIATIAMQAMLLGPARSKQFLDSIEFPLT